MQGVFHSTNTKTIRLGVYAIIAPSAKAAMLLMMSLPSTRFVQALFVLWQLCVRGTAYQICTWMSQAPLWLAMGICPTLIVAHWCARNNQAGMTC
jgi:hypothetical protein